MKTDEMHNEQMEPKPVLPLASLWQWKMTTKFGANQRSLTLKELGQLKMLKLKIGTYTYCVIEWALDNWMRFAEQAKAEDGLSSAPARPHVGFLLAHYRSALDLITDVAESTHAYNKKDEWFKHWVSQMTDEHTKKFAEEVSMEAEIDAEGQKKLA